MKKTVKKLILILLIFILAMSISNKVSAWSSIIEAGQDFIKAGESGDKDTTGIDKEGVGEKLESLSGYLYNLLLSAGVIVAVVVATILGIQFMMGGAEGQAKVKEMLVPFVVGCVVVFGGFGIWKIAMVIGYKIESVQTVKQDTADGVGGGIDAGSQIKPVKPGTTDVLDAIEEGIQVKPGQTK